MKKQQCQNQTIQQQRQSIENLSVYDGCHQEIFNPYTTEFRISDQTKEQKQVTFSSLSSFPNNKTQLMCQQHMKPYRYVCQACQMLLCQKCHCRNEEVNWPFASMHRIIQVTKFIQKLRQTRKNSMTVKQQQYCIIEQYERKSKKIQHINKIQSQINAKTRHCIQILSANQKKCCQLLEKSKQSLQRMYLKRLQQKIDYLQYSKIVEEVTDGKRKQSQLITRVICNWSRLQTKNKKSTSNAEIKQIIGIKSSSNLLQSNLEKDFSLEYSDLIIKQVIDQMENIKQELSKELNFEIKAKQFCSLQAQSFKLQTYSKNSSKSPPLKRKSFENHQALSQVKNFQLRQSLKSVTNEIVKQIRKSKQKVNYSPKKKVNEINQIIIYGSQEPNKLMQIYYPWKIDNELNKDILKQGHNHTDFGMASIINSDQSKSIIVFGGLIKNQVSDCIFRVDYKRKKKQLISRIPYPLAKFGCAVQKNQQDPSSNIKIYICGGQSTSKIPLSNFFYLQFSRGLTFLSKSQLANLQQPRHSLTLTKHKQYLYAVGGTDSENKSLKTVTRYCLRQLKWFQIGNLCLQRSSHNSVSLKSGFYVVGGWNGQNYLRSVERLDENKQKFQIIMEMKQPRSSFGVMGCPQSNAIVILGGKNVTQLSSCQYLSFKHRTSCYIKPLKLPKSGFSCCLFLKQVNVFVVINIIEISKIS